MKAVIYPTGNALRLRPLTCDQPLGRLPLFGKPICEWQSALCTRHGFSEPLILKDCTPAELAARSAQEELLLMADNLICDANLTELLQLHRESGLPASQVYTEPDESQACGLFLLGQGALSKAQAEELISGMAPSFGKIVLPCASVRITSLQDYVACHRMMLSAKESVFPKAQMLKDGLWIEDGVKIERGVKLETPAYLCAGTVVERGASIGAFSVVGSDCRLQAGSRLKGGILFQNVTLGPHSKVSGAVLAAHTTVGRDCRIYENACIGSSVVLEPDCTVKPDLKIWPHKRIPAGAVVSENLVHGSRLAVRLFSQYGICGESNVEVTPEFTAKLGVALGSMFRGGKIGLSHDASPASAVLMAALCAGIQSTGAGVYVFGEQTLPMTRSGIGYYGLHAGVHLNAVKIGGVYYPALEFLQSNGASFDERAERRLEDIYLGEAFWRCEPEAILQPVALDGYKYFYIQAILNRLGKGPFQKNAELQTRSETVSELLELLLRELEQRMELPAEKEFYAEISENGERVTLSTPAGKALSDEQLLALFSRLLPAEAGRRFVLPYDASEALRRDLAERGFAVVMAPFSRRAFLRTVLEQGTEAQFRLCFDGIYAVILLLDYLNRNRCTFQELLTALPVIYKKEVHVTCPDEQLRAILERLKKQYQDQADTFGVKIPQENGWAMILPDGSARCIRIITEGESMEAAEEIAAVLKNKVKKLASSEGM